MDINVADRCRGPAEEQEKVMRTLGYVTAITVAAAGTALGILAVKIAAGNAAVRSDEENVVA
jgi:hypothetical protein